MLVVLPAHGQPVNTTRWTLLSSLFYKNNVSLKSGSNVLSLPLTQNSKIGANANSLKPLLTSINW